MTSKTLLYLHLTRVIPPARRSMATLGEPVSSGLLPPPASADARRFSYCNSVLQALYYCQPFRECVTEYTPLMLGSNYSKAGSAPTSPMNGPKDAPAKTSAFDFRRDKKKDVSAAPAASLLKSANEARSEKEVLEYLEAEETLLGTLKDLFGKIQAQKKRTGVIGPQHFVNRLKKENGGFP